MDGLEADVRYGWTKDGGGNQLRFGLADGFSVGKFSGVVGGQYEKIDPIWGYQRPKTQQYFTGNANSPQIAERDWLVIGNPLRLQQHQLPVPRPDQLRATCQASSAARSASIPSGRSPAGDGGPGYYCGTYRAGFYTIGNGQENTQGYMHLNYDINSSIQIFADALLSHEVMRFNTGSRFYRQLGQLREPAVLLRGPDGGTGTVPEPAAHLLARGSR